MLIALSEVCRWTRPRLEAETESAYLLQGLLLVTLGFFAYFDGWQIGLILAAQSIVLLGRALGRAERLPLWASLASAGAAFVVAANRLADWQATVPPLSAVGAGGLLVLAAWWGQRWLDRAPGRAAAPETTAHGFTRRMRPARGFTRCSGARSGCGQSSGPRGQRRARPGAGGDRRGADCGGVPVADSGGAVLRAGVFAGGIFPSPRGNLACRFGRLGRTGVERGGTCWPPRWRPATGGRRVGREPATGCPRPGRSQPASPDGRLPSSSCWSADWLRPGLTGPLAETWAAAAAVLSLAVLGYGRWTGYRALSVAGQAILAASIAACVGVVWARPWSGGFGIEAAWTLVPLAVLLATTYVVRQYFAEDEYNGPNLAWRVVCEVAATIFFLAWGWRYVPAEGRFAFFAAAGGLVLAWAQVRREPRHVWWSAVLALAGVASLALLARDERAAFIHLIGIGALAGQQQFARIWSRRDPPSAATVPPPWQTTLMTGATLCAWTVLNARVSILFGGTFTLAASWSLFAAAVFAFGLWRHEKIYRWLGLGILVCTLGRIGVVDIWQLDSLGRAGSAMCPGDRPARDRISL